jgi:hypothetical protein
MHYPLIGHGQTLKILGAVGAHRRVRPPTDARTSPALLGLSYNRF